MRVHLRELGGRFVLAECKVQPRRRQCSLGVLLVGPHRGAVFVQRALEIAESLGRLPGQQACPGVVGPAWQPDVEGRQRLTTLTPGGEDTRLHQLTQGGIFEIRQHHLCPVNVSLFDEHVCLGELQDLLAAAGGGNCLL